MYSAKEVKEIAHVVNSINVDQMRATVRSIRRDPATKETWKATTMWKEGSYVQTRLRDPCASGSTSALVRMPKLHANVR
jgi:hypothetical protein